MQCLYDNVFCGQCFFVTMFFIRNVFATMFFSWVMFFATIFSSSGAMFFVMLFLDIVFSDNFL